MSIAVSVVVKPSRLLFALVAAIAAGAALIGVAIGLGAVGSMPFWLRAVTQCLCLLLAFAGLMHAALHRKTYQLDISGVGQIRLRQDTPRHNATQEHAKLVTLQADSTLWPQFLFLRLRTENAAIDTVVVLPDSLPPESFRALAVACRWIAAHNLNHVN
jgi:toxin CptA